MAHVPASERRPQLIQAAIDLMAREGIAAGSTRAIAAELGVAQATVHYTFGTKKDLYRSVVEELTAEFIHQVRAASPGDGSFGEQVRTMVYALWESAVAEGGRCALITEFTALSLRDPDLQEIMRAVQHEIESTAAELLTALAEAHGQTLAVPADEIAVLFLVGFNGLTDRYMVLRRAGERPDAVALHTLDLLIATTIGLCLGAPARLP
ncbi:MULTISPECIES: TetR/AcrR family transcriptional regulator [unclassified Streptomyces]|uniref:TetR/AcrR family transcriptional regulator n=1 Tax=Streptomycetaceae TaxID=2062 RepID=UPI002E75B289|nr:MULTISPECIES: TetR/AcrR family transcriptional regulator [unclassified Streptomyces]MED7950192.1 TetR/AcrR family transcriptional regulator [Streptomyces sp. BE303]MEE1821664.1 TetR/AcrR family transcriptional regulator [Streptomyces sp. BE20]